MNGVLGDTTDEFVFFRERGRPWLFCLFVCLDWFFVVVVVVCVCVQCRFVVVVVFFNAGSLG